MTEPYVLYGERVDGGGGGYVKEIAPLKEGSLIQFCTKVQRNNSHTFYCDKYWESGSNLLCGADWSVGENGGLWCYNGTLGSSGTKNSYGGRLCYKPPV